MQTLTCRVPSHLAHELQELARTSDRPLSQVIRKLLEEGVVRRQEALREAARVRQAAAQ